MRFAPIIILSVIITYKCPKCASEIVNPKLPVDYLSCLNTLYYYLLNGTIKTTSKNKVLMKIISVVIYQVPQYL